MGMHRINKMPSPEELQQEFPLSGEARQIKKARDEEIKKVFTGESEKFIVIIGPCSADNETAVMDYLGRLAGVQEKVSDKLLMIPTAPDTREWFTSRTLRKLRIWPQVSVP